MKRLYRVLFIVTVSLLSIFSFNIANAQEVTAVTVNGQPMIITTAPAPKEVIVIPQGYINCFTVPAGWNYNNVWVEEHKVCQYASKDGSAAQGVAWVDSYWGCTKYKDAAHPKQGECTNWEWQPGHWVKTLEVY